MTEKGRKQQGLLERRIPWTVRCQEIIWVVRQGVRQAVLAEARKELEMMETRKTGRREEGKTDCGL